jgi:hypothetical protein
MNAKTCDHTPGAHKPRPFWFADQLDPDDDGYSPHESRWKAFLQVDDMVCPIEPVFMSKAQVLEFIRTEILKAVTICDD